MLERGSSAWRNFSRSQVSSEACRVCGGAFPASLDANLSFLMKKPVAWPRPGLGQKGRRRERQRKQKKRLIHQINSSRATASTLRERCARSPWLIEIRDEVVFKMSCSPEMPSMFRRDRFTHQLRRVPRTQPASSCNIAPKALMNNAIQRTKVLFAYAIRGCSAGMAPPDLIYAVLTSLLLSAGNSTAELAATKAEVFPARKLRARL